MIIVILTVKTKENSYFPQIWIKFNMIRIKILKLDTLISMKFTKNIRKILSAKPMMMDLDMKGKS